jgi:splicing factor 3A subunit 1
MDMDEDEDDGIRIVPASTYQPRLNPQAAGLAAPQTLVDPLSGKVVPADQISEHMRVQLLDPRWREEQRRFQDKQKETGLVAGDLISQNLRVFAQNRTDIIDNSNLNSAPAGPSAPIGAAGPGAAFPHPPPPPPPPPPPRPPAASDDSEEVQRSKRTRK